MAFVGQDDEPVTDTARLTAVVHGVVQGVFFRPFVYSHALDLGLVGYARNLPGGRRVEVVAEGGRAALEELVELLKQGPPAARVEKVETQWSCDTGLFDGFEVR
ncbi:MAG: acylphosphatase [Chloroflexi bacterium]|nr:acylphosphatase [Chloroflexota bacterium]